MNLDIRQNRIQQKFKGLPLQPQHLPVHQTGTIYRLTLKVLENNDKEVQATPEQIKKVGEEADRLTKIIPNCVWFSKMPQDGERLLLSGPLKEELHKLLLMGQKRHATISITNCVKNDF